MKIVVLDTSFLVACAEFRIDYADELERVIDEKFGVVTVEGVLCELDSLVEKGGKVGAAARLARTILKQRVVQVLPSEGHVDRAILKMAGKDVLVATIDAELKRLLREKGVSRVVIRKKKYLIVEV